MQDPNLAHLIFALSSLLLLLASVGVVLVRNPVRATALLILSFLPTSLIYILLQAPFVGLLQVLVYAGAIMMLFTFVIMMINPSPNGGEIPGSPGQPPGPKLSALAALVIAGLAGLAFIPAAYRAAGRVEAGLPAREDFGSLASIAELLFRDPAENPLTVSFELMSLLILVGIIAALNFSRRKGIGDGEVAGRDREVSPATGARLEDKKP